VRTTTSPSAALLALGLAGLLAACGGGGGDPQSEAAATLADEVIVPAYAAEAAAAATLERRMDALCAEPTPRRLAAARSAWTDARAGWKRTEAVWVGPAMDRRSEGLVDWPASTEGVESVLASGRPADRSTVLSTSTSSRGLGAVEHLLFGDGEATAQRLASEPRRCAYARAVAGVVAAETAALGAAWAEGLDGDPPYAETLGGEGEGAMSGEEAIGMVVEDHLFLVQRISDQELGPSLGSRGAVRPEALAEGAAEHGAADIALRLEGLRAAYAPGTEGESLGDLLGERSEDVRGRLLARLDEAIAIARAVKGPLAADAAARRRLAEAVDAVQTVLAAEVVSVLGVTVGFSDNDGDGG
jgi:predicted lipoprotein